MPSPFPGMDPWIESPTHWANMHRHMMTEITLRLNRELTDAFVAVMDENVYLLPASEKYLPDVTVRRTPSFAAAAPHSPSVLLASRREATTALEIVEETEEVREPFVKVLTTHDDRRVVTVIEILSPVNKIGAGREQYRKKQLDMLEGDVHLLEIDLLRAGQHTVAAPPASILRRYGMAWDYVISLHRARTGNRYACWPFTLYDSLPVVDVPLTVGYSDIPLDTGAIFATCYDGGAFRRSVDYSQPPTPRLKPSDMQWAAEWLKPR